MNRRAHITVVLLFLTFFRLAAVSVPDRHGPAGNGASDISLSEDMSGEDRVYVSKTRVRLLPGFRFKSSDGAQGSASAASFTFRASTDPTLVTAPGEGRYLTPSGLWIANPSRGSVVGAIDGSFSVSPTGAATYTIPLDVPSGVKGVQPSLSLVYSSQAGNGLLGWGWSLQGLSSVTRTPKRLFHDGCDSPVSWSAADALLLDGQRLVAVSVSEDSVEYRTERESWQKIVGYDIRSWGPSFFTVKTKEGLTLRYGTPGEMATYNPAFIPSSVGHDSLPPVPMSWNLVSVEDADGNGIRYEYATSFAGRPGNVVTSVAWGFNGHVSDRPQDTLSVRFDYEGREDTLCGYVSGNGFLQTVRLKTIRICHGDNELSRYTLDYASTSGGTPSRSRVSRLEGVTFSSGAEHFPPLHFTYGSERTAESHRDVSYAKYDDEGNGKDIVALTSLDLDRDGTDEWGECFSYPDLFMGTGQELMAWRRADDDRDPEGYIVLSSSCQNYWNGQSPLMGDFDADGSMETVTATVTPSTRDLSIKIKNWKKGLFLTGENLSEAVSLYMGTSESPFLAVGRFYGEYFSDLIVIFDNPQTVSGGYSYPYRMLRGSASAVTLVDNTHYLTLPGKIEDVRAVSFTGCPYTEDLLVTLTGGGSVVVKNNPSNAARFSNTSCTGWPLTPFDRYTMAIADINMDGCNDVVYRSDTSRWHIAYGRGDGTFSVTEAGLSCTRHLLPGSIWPHPKEECDKVSVVDYDGDGLPDIVMGDESFVNVGSGYGVFVLTTYRFYRNTGRGFVHDFDRLSPRSSSLCVFADLDGNGTVDWLHFDENDSLVITDFGYGLGRGLLSAVSSQAFGDESVTYTTQTESERDSRGKGYTASLPQDVMGVWAERGVLPMVGTTFTVVDSHERGGVGERYRFRMLPMDWQRGRLLGFSTVACQTEAGGTPVSRTVTAQSFDAVAREFLSSDTKCFLPGNGPLTDVFDYDPDNVQGEEDMPYRSCLTVCTVSRIGNGPRYRVVPSETVETDRLSGITETSTWQSYDPYGNPLVTVRQKGLLRQTTTVSYVQAGAWCPSRPSEVHVRCSRDGSADSEEHDRTFTYDGRGHLTSETSDPGSTLSLSVTRSDFDVWGHPLVLTTSSADGFSRRVSSTYTADGRFLSSETDVLGQTVTYEWDLVRGTLTSETSSEGTTSYTYDAFGRLTGIVRPDGIRTVRALRWSDRPGSLWYSYEETSGESPVRTWYDSRGLQTARQWQSRGGQTVEELREYDAMGRLSRVSVPSFTGQESSVAWAAGYAYDSYGRVSRCTDRGDTVSYSYGTPGNSSYVTAVSPTGTRTVVQDRSGQTVSVTTDGKQVAFAYDVMGRVLSATPQGGRAVTFAYDLRGNRTRVSDPDAGTVIRSFNAFDQIVTEKRAVGDRPADPDTLVTTCTYRPSGGQLLSVTRHVESASAPADETVAYSYDDAHPDRIASVTLTSDDGLASRLLHSRSFAYDAFGRLASQTDVVPTDDAPVSYVHTYTYDRLGRLKDETFPSGLSVRNRYDTYGHLISVDGPDGRPLYEPLTSDAEGRLTSESRGGVTTAYTYDSHGRLTSVSAADIVSEAYAYGASGDLLSRSDRLSGRLETFTYDSLHRLTSAVTCRDEGIPDTVRYVYDTSYGNMVSKSDIDSLGNGYTFCYGSPLQADAVVPGPHALTAIMPAQGVASSPSEIPSRDLDIAYTPFSKVRSLSDGMNTYTLLYGADDQRIRSVLAETYHATVPATGQNVTGIHRVSRTYLGDYEEVEESDTRSQQTTVRRIHSLTGGGLLVETQTMSSRQGQSGDVSQNLYYAYSDRLGSVRSITDGDGRVMERRHYDAWGRPEGVLRTDITPRGFTGHEHIGAFGLIDMNGRMYDPVTAQFLSPDPYIQSPGSWLNYNRYAYCLHNPLMYTDPTGEIFVFDDILIAASIGAIINVGIQGISNNISNPGDYFLAAGFGALAGVAGGIVGQAVAGALGTATSFGCAVANGALVGLSGGFAGGFVSSAGNAWMGGSSFEQGLQAGLVGGGYGALGGALMGGVSGAIQYQKQISIFQKGCIDLGINEGDPVPATDQFLSDAQKVWYKDAPLNNVEVFTVENVPENHLTGKSGLITNNAYAKTVPLSVDKVFTGNSNVYFNKDLAFSNAKQLFFTMGHEFVHVSQFAELAGSATRLLCDPGFIKLLEFHAYNYQHFLGGLHLNSFAPDVVNGLVAQYSEYFKSLGFTNFGWTLSASFKYPF